jgi:hypothetical protein
MRDESTKPAAEEFLAARISAEGQNLENQLNQEAAIALGPTVRKRVVTNVTNQSREWNAVTNEQSLACKETALGDIRILCAGRPYQMLVHYDSRKALVMIKNSARPEGEPDTILSIEGYANDGRRDARLTRNVEPINLAPTFSHSARSSMKCRRAGKRSPATLWP